MRSCVQCSTVALAVLATSCCLLHCFGTAACEPTGPLSQCVCVCVSDTVPTAHQHIWNMGRSQGAGQVCASLVGRVKTATAVAHSVLAVRQRWSLMTKRSRKQGRFFGFSLPTHLGDLFASYGFTTAFVCFAADVPS